jgi:hypothetical protein
MEVRKGELCGLFSRLLKYFPFLRNNPMEIGVSCVIEYALM